MMVHLFREEIADRDLLDVSLPGKVLQARDTVRAARTLLTHGGVTAIPILEGARYVGAVDAALLEDVADEAAPLGRFAAATLPTATASTPVPDAFAALDENGATRLVVLDPDGRTYAGLVCLRGDRRRLCVDTQRLGL